VIAPGRRGKEARRISISLGTDGEEFYDDLRSERVISHLVAGPRDGLFLFSKETIDSPARRVEQATRLGDLHRGARLSLVAEYTRGSCPPRI
jgi:hypothetical protein